jgi:hypothetical protein
MSIRAAFILFAVAPLAAAAQGGSAVVVKTKNTAVVPFDTSAVRAPGAPTVTIAAGPQYQGSGFRRFFLGDGYRDLWVKPIKVPLLDLHTFSGGLKPLKSGGGMQSKSLRLEAPDGIEYVFRIVDKSHSFTVPAFLKGSFVEGASRDQVSNFHPAGAIAAARMEDATGVLHVTPVLVVMPDDPELGEFRAAYAGKLGIIEEYPHKPAHASGFAGAEGIIDSEELLKLLNTDPRERVDARALLTVRLMDMLLGDWDRHPGQWKWAQMHAKPPSAWIPIARDRDMVFVTYGGIIGKVGGLVSPISIAFTSTYSSIHAQTWDSAEMDRRLLGGLDKATWDSVAAEVTRRITDPVIDSAVQAMPAEYLPSEPRLASTLKQRRAHLPEIASRFYRFVFDIADIHATDASDRATITRVSDGVVDVRIESGDASPTFVRRFEASETREIRVYLHDGDDSAVVTGNVQRSILVRVIGGNGTNHLVDSSTVAGRHNQARLSDAGSVTGVKYGKDTLFNRRPWDEEGGKSVPPAPDRGVSYSPLVGLSTDRGFGIAPRVGLARFSHGYGQRPYASRISLEAEFAPDVDAFRTNLSVDERLESSPVHFIATARMSQLEMTGYYGLGNATADSGFTSDYFGVRQRLWMLRPAVALALSSASDLSLGPVIEYSSTDSGQNRFIFATRPYGFGNFGQTGLQLSLHHDARALQADRQHGFRFDVSASVFPAIWDVKSAFEEVSAAIAYSASIAVPTHPTLILRGGGKKLFGAFPFYESAFIGGNNTTRFMDPQRYAGDAALFGTTELRAPLVDFSLVLPLKAGIIGVADAGRVWVDGDSPGGWHTVAGGGFFISLLDESSLLSFMLTNERGHSGVQVRTGLRF